MTLFEWCNRHEDEQLRFRYSGDCGVIIYSTSLDGTNHSVEDLDDKDIIDIIELAKIVLSRYENVDLMFYKNKTDFFPCRIEVILKKSSILSKDLHYIRILDPNEDFLLQVSKILGYAKEEFVNFIFGRRDWNL